MTEYLVLKRIPTGDTKVDLVEALTDLGYVRPDMSEDKLQIYIAQARVDRLEAERDQARQARDINASHKDDYEKRWKSVQEQRNAVIQKCNRFGEELGDLRRKAKAHKEQISKLDEERDELLNMLDDMGPRVDKAEAATHQARVERDEAQAEAQTALEAVEKVTAQRNRIISDGSRRHEQDATRIRVLRECKDKIAGEHDKSRANCTSLRETVAGLLNELDARPSKLSCLSCGSTDYVWYFNNGEVAYCSDCRGGPPPPKPPLKPPVCPRCGHDTFKPLAGGGVLSTAVFKGDGTIADLYFFVCAKCGKEVGTLPLKRTDK
jgi:hypothetical protein